MATQITLRSVKGSGLTIAEIDANFTALQTTADAALAGGGGSGATVQVGALTASTTAAPNATAVQTALSGYAVSGHGHAVAAISGAQATLVSGSNIKTVNGTSLLGAGDVAIAGGSGAAAQNALTPASTTLSPSVDSVVAALALKADYLAPGIITAATTLIRSPTSPATNGFNRVQYCSVTVATTVTATGAQAQVGDFIVLDNSNPASTAAITLAGVTARSGYTLIAQPGTIVEALCVAAGSFQANTANAVVAGGASGPAFFDGPSFAIIPQGLTAIQVIGTANATVTGVIASRGTQAGKYGNRTKVGIDGATSAIDVLAGFEGGAGYFFDTRAFVVEFTFGVADALGQGAKTAVGFAINNNSTGAGTEIGSGFNESKLMFAHSPNAGETQFKLYASDNTISYPVATVLNAGTGFPTNTNSVDWYRGRFEYYPADQGGRRVVWKLTNVITDVVATGTITATTQIPAAAQAVYFQAYRSSGSVVGIPKISVGGVVTGSFV